MTPQAELQQFKLDPGGSIPTNAPENQAFFAQLQATPALSTADLLKIAKFLQGYVTNMVLATHLASTAIQRLTRSPLLQQALTAQGDMDVDGTPLKEVAKLASDVFSGNLAGPDPRAGIRWFPITTPIPDLGLLVETHVSTVFPDNPLSYAIGICPAPASLPD